MHGLRRHARPPDGGGAGALHGGEERPLNEPEGRPGSPGIETARLVLRPLAPEDLDGIHRIGTDPGVRRCLWDGGEIPRGGSRDVLSHSLKSFEEHGFGLWAVIPKGSEVLIGFCGFWSSGEDGRGGELLHGMETPYWGEGLATEAAGAVIRHGFEEIGLERIVAGADTEKAGLRRGGRDLRNGQNLTYYAISREAFRGTFSDAPG